MLMGMVEVGFLLHSTYVVATAAREGARFASRGIHLDETSGIEDVIKTSLQTGVNVIMDGVDDANTRIWVTYIDIDKDSIESTSPTPMQFGDLDVPSRVCTASPCGSDTIDVTEILTENVDFNSDPTRCNDLTYGCRDDLVIVEIYYDHELMMATPFVDFFLDLPVRIDQHGIMRVMIARNPFET